MIALHRTSLQLLRSISPNKLPEPIANYVVNPDMSAVDGVPRKYQKLVGNTPTEMDTAEKFAVDEAIEQRETDAEIDGIENGATRRGFRVLLTLINAERTDEGKPPITMAQFITRLRNI